MSNQISTEGELISEKAILRLMNHIKAEAGGGSYTLPAASDSTLGGVKVGSNLKINKDGVLNIKFSNPKISLIAENGDSQWNGADGLSFNLTVPNNVDLTNESLVWKFELSKSYSSVSTNFEVAMPIDENCHDVIVDNVSPISGIEDDTVIKILFTELKEQRIFHVQITNVHAGEEEYYCSYKLWGDNGEGTFYTLPPATTENLGGIKVGQNLTIDLDGTLNAQTSGGGDTNLFLITSVVPIASGKTIFSDNSQGDIGERLVTNDQIADYPFIAMNIAVSDTDSNYTPMFNEELIILSTNSNYIHSKETSLGNLFKNENPAGQEKIGEVWVNSDYGIGANFHTFYDNINIYVQYEIYGLTTEVNGSGGGGGSSLAPLPLGSEHQNILSIDILANSEDDDVDTLTTVDLKSDLTWDIYDSVVTLGIREYNSEGTSFPAQIGSSPWISITWYNYGFTWSAPAPHAPTVRIPNCLRFVGILDNYIISLDQSGSSMEIRTESGQARRIYVYMIKH